ncbi:hypothetical protein BDF19DRAFT_439983, partial [Syncephalis fuscata]
MVSVPKRIISNLCCRLFALSRASVARRPGALPILPKLGLLIGGVIGSPLKLSGLNGIGGGTELLVKGILLPLKLTGGAIGLLAGVEMPDAPGNLAGAGVGGMLGALGTPDGFLDLNGPNHGAALTETAFVDNTAKSKAALRIVVLARMMINKSHN